jgi:hypothetical protein
MRGRILETGVASQLSYVDDVRVTIVSDRRKIKGEILKMQPSVVILDADAAVSRSAQVLELLDALPKLRILLVHLDSNVVEVYDKQEITLREAADLVGVIQRAWPDAAVVTP